MEILIAMGILLFIASVGVLEESEENI